MKYGQLIIVSIVLSISAFGQSYERERDSIQKEIAIWKKQYSDSYKKIVKDSIDFTGILLGALPGGCGTDDYPALLIFKITRTHSKNIQDTIGVLIAHGCQPVIEKYHVNNQYSFRVTSHRFYVNGDNSWGKYKNARKYYFLKDLTDTSK